MSLNESQFNFPEADLVKQTEICKNCKNIVVGKGNLNAKILFLFTIFVYITLIFNALFKAV